MSEEDPTSSRVTTVASVIGIVLGIIFIVLRHHH
jgi:hypothetical protein